LLSTLASTGCGGGSGMSVVKDCVLPQDQLGTLTGKWRTTPVPIALHQGDFSSSEAAQIIEAANTWNAFYANSLGLAPIDFGSGASPRTSSAGRPSGVDICNSQLVQGSTYSGPIVVYKNSVWNFPDQPSVIALTSYCRTQATPLPFFYMQLIDLNYQNFFSTGNKQPDLQTIILHEFGHLLGLNHTCEATARAGVPSCNSPDLNPTYSSALMFPTFNFDSATLRGEIKRSLNSNDQGRANCLYMDFNN
jgi:hypothetical protein